MQFPALFKPFSLKNLHFPNRIVMAPMTRNMSKNNIPGTAVAEYYRKRAEGGIGLIITEGVSINHPAAKTQSYPDVPNFYGLQALSAWRHIVDEVHRVGGYIFPQLWHVGSARSSKLSSGSNPQDAEQIPGYGPSAIAHPYIPDGGIPHEMTKKDISDTIQAFAQAAKDAQNLGFDGVEIHGAHGYLIDQFFWDRTNQRTDEYGGRTLSERTRFAVEIIQAIRKAVGPAFPIDFRFSQWKLGDYSAKLAHTPEELESFLRPLSDAGVDIFHCSTRVFENPEFSKSNLNLAGWTKKLINKPAITVGSVGLDMDFIKTHEADVMPQRNMDTIKILENKLEKEEFDLVAVGRALLADPAWGSKLHNGNFNSIVPFSKAALLTLN